MSLRIERLRKCTCEDPSGETTFDPELVCVVNDETGTTTLTDNVDPMLTRAWKGDPDKPRDLAELANLFRRDKPKKHRLIALLDYAHTNAMATFDELRAHVYEGYDASEETIEGNIKEARKLIRRYKIPVRLSVSRAVVSRKYISA